MLLAVAAAGASCVLPGALCIRSHGAANNVLNDFPASENYCGAASRFCCVSQCRLVVVPLYRHSVVPLYRHSVVPLYRHSGARA
jgi:hypothetical protein